MGTFVWQAATAHTGAMLRVTPTDEEDRARAERVLQAFRSLSGSLRSAGAEVLVTIGTDHFLTFEYGNLPIFAVGTGDRFSGWGEFGVPQRDYTGIASFGAQVQAGLVAKGFDVAGARDMKLDHSFCCPLQLLMDSWPVPVLPLYVNCTVEPLPSISRCRDLGKALGDVIREQSAVQRVAILGTGGISHSVGTPRTGTIDPIFDRRFLDLFCAGRIDEIASWNSDEIIETAGNGAAEIRNWVLAAAAVGGRGARLLSYEPVRAWATGMAAAQILT